MQVPISRLLLDRGKQLDLQVIAGEGGLENMIVSPEMNRPGLAFAGFFDVFSHDRVQILGNTETSYLQQLPDDVRAERLRRLFEFQIPCFIVTHNNVTPPDLLRAGDAHRVPILATTIPTSRFSGQLSLYLERAFAETATQHAVFLDVFGLGVMIKGSSGVGKSEVALELIERGHRLIADDVVVLKRLGKDTLMGSAMNSTAHHMEVRGLGIVDVELLFGVGSVREEMPVSLVVNLEKWTDQTQVDRYGADARYQTFLGVEVRQYTIPVESGRNISILVEVAALQARIHSTGRNPALELNEQIIKQMNRSRLV